MSILREHAYVVIGGEGNAFLKDDGTTSEVTISSSVPATATDTGTAGQVAFDSGFIYVCVATNTWKRAAISTW